MIIILTGHVGLHILMVELVTWFKGYAILETPLPQHSIFQGVEFFQPKGNV